MAQTIQMGRILSVLTTVGMKTAIKCHKPKTQLRPAAAAFR